MNRKSENTSAPAYVLLYNNQWRAAIITGWYGLPGSEDDPAFVRVTTGDTYYVVSLDRVQTREQYDFIDWSVLRRSEAVHKNLVRRHYRAPLIDLIVPHIGTLRQQAQILPIWQSAAFMGIGA